MSMARRALVHRVPMRHPADVVGIEALFDAGALVGGIAAAATGRTDLVIAGGAEHQGLDGGGPVAVIVRRP